MPPHVSLGIFLLQAVIQKAASAEVEHFWPVFLCAAPPPTAAAAAAPTDSIAVRCSSPYASLATSDGLLQQRLRRRNEKGKENLSSNAQGGETLPTGAWLCFLQRVFACARCVTGVYIHRKKR